MFKRILNTLCFLFCFGTSAFAGTGDLFVVTSNGTGNTISLTLCLNIHGQNPLSCQTYASQAGTLQIRTTIPNKTYQYAGISINTPGYAYSVPPEVKGYSFLGMVSSTQPTTGTVTPINSQLSTTNPSNVTVNSGQTATFSTSASGGTTPYSYQWQVSTNAGTSFNNIAGATLFSYTTNTLSTADNGNQYLVIVTDAASNSVTSEVATLTVTSPHIIFVTTTTYTGNLGGFSGADAKCNADPGKPGGFASAYTYKALLDGNNATVSGTAYYRVNGTTLIATATGGNLVGSDGLTNSINTSSSPTVWTGANGGTNCSNWGSDAGNGIRGDPSKSDSRYWNTGTSICSASRALYCASQ